MALASPDRPPDTPDYLRSLRLNLTGSYYKVARALGMRRLQDMLSVRAGLPAAPAARTSRLAGERRAHAELCWPACLLPARAHPGPAV